MRRRWRRAALVALLASLAAGAPGEAAEVRYAPPPPEVRTAPDPRMGVRQALAWTVSIHGDGVYGAGLLILPARGLVLTSEHVIDGVDAPSVTFFDGRTASARVVDVDRALDLALLQVPPQPQRPAPPLGDATSLAPADEVFAIGNPRKLGFTVTRGIVSFVGRPMEGARYLQTDLPTNEGNSGGPVLDSRGEVVGVMSFILRRAQGLAFALPINYAVERFAGRLPPQPERAGYLARFRRWLAAPASPAPAIEDRQPASPPGR